ncbi:tyrosine-protein phosphatase non-receptor type 9-like [Anneissia japonica]|uniref:tyrosine-protein phosphatase non-receptor type 9-like n=1 Tax=Anneissia japonica TaxID=1529436 RepID=UPI0014257CEC|nr:tyrosine-protein phosphatase non-receptor type 9-like [Anneissia japonica]
MLTEGKMAAVLTPVEEQATKIFLDHLNRARENYGAAPVSWNIAVRFLMARKFDIKRALELFKNHMALRHKECLTQIVPTEEQLSKELHSGKFTILPNRDSGGAAIALYTAKLHNPSTTSSHTVLKAVVFQLDHALADANTQRNGLVFVYNMTDSNLSNFEINFSRKLLSMLRDGYPARLKRVYVVAPPLWFKAMYGILKPLLKEKIRERVILVNLERLVKFLPKESLPSELGGTAVLNHMDWLKSCLNASYEKRITTDFCEELNDGPTALSANEKAVELFSQDNYLTSRTISIDSNKDQRTDMLNSVLPIQASNWQQSPSIEASVSPSTNGIDSNGDNMAVHPVIDPKIFAIVQTLQVTSDDEDGDMPSLPPPKPPRPEPGTNSPPPPIPVRVSSTVPDGESIHRLEDKGMTPAELVEHMQELKQHGIYKEYADIRSEPPSGSFSYSKSKRNIPKNRYADVLCFDHSRVRLVASEDDLASDYINSNYVDGFMHKNAFIAAQGPLPNTINDYWRMIWQENILVIVMTTRTVERGRTKCAQYWPPDPETAEEYGQMTVVNLEVEKKRDYIVSTLFVQNNSLGECRKIAHYQFTSWPDFGVPRSALAMLEFRDEVRQYQREAVESMGSDWTGHPNGPPILVHCSAGIGRTGTFCTIDITLARLEVTQKLNIYDTVRKMRTQRAFSIQTPDQYEFCHFAVLESLQRAGKLPPVDWTAYEECQDSDSD